MSPVAAVPALDIRSLDAGYGGIRVVRDLSEFIRASIRSVVTF